MVHPARRRDRDRADPARHASPRARLERGADVQDIVNMAAVAVVDAQERSRHSEPLFAIPLTPTPALASRT
jgi:hypothetical protein